MASRVVLAHGFTQTARSWATVQELLAARGINDTVAVDLPGHGAAADVELDLSGSAEHLVDVGGTGTYVGYSMGGRVAMHAALAHPDAVERLVLIGATAGIEDGAERAARNAADRELAARIESIGIERFIDEWLASPLFAGLGEEIAQRRDRMRNTPQGLASSLRLAGTGTQRPLWARLGEITVPVLIVVGEHDAKFRRIGEQLRNGLPHADLQVIAGAGHCVQLEQPESTVDVLCGWFATV